MMHLFLGEEKWFRAKKYGYGAGLPIKWQGWAFLAAYTLIIVGAGQLVRLGGWAGPIAALLICLGATLLCLIIAKHKTEGEWKWRSGGES